MKLRVEQITAEPLRREVLEPNEEINRRLEGGATHDFRLVGPLAGEVSYYRAGDKLFFEGRLGATMEGTCARCLVAFSLEVRAPFEFVLTPAVKQHAAEELSIEDLSLSFYSGDEVDLGPLLAEQTILALPTRALCQEDCRGLCPSCGANRNTETCDCPVEAGDPRLAVLNGLRARGAS